MRACAHAGIEWDDASRGKGDGAVTCADGSTVRYFTYVHATRAAVGCGVRVTMMCSRSVRVGAVCAAAPWAAPRS
ncbi:hypothetical protein EON67_05760 [archaeon]|nr:MAG: hypothetical protein EON67_05760 [archaeon]